MNCKLNFHSVTIYGKILTGNFSGSEGMAGCNHIQLQFKI